MHDGWEKAEYVGKVMEGLFWGRFILLVGQMCKF